MDGRMTSGTVLLATLLAGCATVDDRLQTMQRENARLAREISEVQAVNLRLDQENKELSVEKTYQTKRAAALEREKRFRMEEIGALRGGVQIFSDKVVAKMREIYEETVPLDYMGSELCIREGAETRTSCLFVDMEHAFTSSGTLLGGRAFLLGPFEDAATVQLQYCVLRPDEQGQLKVQWMSNMVTAEKEGRCDWRFDFPFQVYPGDIYAVYAAGAVTIPFDDADTGNVIVVPGGFKTGSVVVVPPAGPRNKQAYSIGVTGYFNGR